MNAAPQRPARIGPRPSACVRPALPRAPSQAVATSGSGTKASRAARAIATRRPQRSVRNSRNASGTPSGRAIASVAEHDHDRRRGQPERAGNAGGFPLRRRRTRSARPRSAPELCSHAARTVASTGQPRSSTRTSASTERARIDFTSAAPRCASGGPSPRTPRAPSPRSGPDRAQYSSSIETVASSSPSPWIACR